MISNQSRILISLVSLLTCSVMLAYSDSTITEDSYRKARGLLDSSLRAHGGIELLSRIKTLTLKEVGIHRYLHQSPSVDPPFQESLREETTAVDFAAGRLFIHSRIFDSKYYESDSTTIINGKESYILDNRSKEAAPIENAALKNYRNHFFQRFPHSVLLEAFEQSATLRSLGEAYYLTNKQNVISFINGDNRQVSLYLDAGTNLLSKAEFIYSDAVVGDGLFEIVFEGYGEIQGMKVPGKRKIIISHETQVETEFKEFQIDDQLQEGRFALPAGFTKVSAQETHNLVVNKISRDVYHVRGVMGSSNALFVDFNKFVVVVDAPRARLAGGASERLIEKIKETVPGKPIQYLVLTTHSFDHSSGLRTFVADGATIITTPGNQGYVERLTAASFTIVPDALTKKPRRAVIEIVRNKKHVLSDENHVLELYDIGPNPICNEILVVYLPKEQILYQTDLINPGYAGTLTPAQIGTMDFAAKLKALGIPIRKILGGHGGELTLEDLNQAIQKRQSFK